jgi:hypothetical protein
LSSREERQRGIANRSLSKRLLSSSLLLVLLALGSIGAGAETIVAQAADDQLTYPPRKGMFVSPRAPAWDPSDPGSLAIPAEGLNLFEKNLNKIAVGNFQGALCVPMDGHVTSLRNAVVSLYQASPDPDGREQADRVRTHGLLPIDVDLLNKILSLNKDCSLKLEGPAAVAQRYWESR